MKKRLFVAINLPDGIKENIGRKVSTLRSSLSSRGTAGHSYFPRFLSPNNWHLTISFLGYQDESDMGTIIDALKAVAENFESPEIRFERIIYGPPGKSPRMIWLLGSSETSEMLSKLKSLLEDDLMDRGLRFRRERRPYTSHLTLARFDSVAKSSSPDIERELPLRFVAKSLDLMESRLYRSGARYETLARFEFKEL